MTNNLSIEFDWLHRDNGDAIERATLAELAMTANKYSAFELEDLTAKSIRKSARVSAYNLAVWFVSNWWKLRWEPKRTTYEWDFSHKIGAAGGGYLWPNVSFNGDGATISIQSESTLFPATGQAIRYINNFSTIITAEEFETKIGFFVESVIARLVDLGINAPELVGLWKEVYAERQDLELSKWRKLEAIMGFDPDEVPDHIVVGLKDASDNYGAGAVEEVAAASQGKVLDILKELSGAPFAESTGLCMPQFDVLQQEISSLGPTLFPWQKGEEAARIARRAWHLDEGSVSTKYLSEIFGFRQELINEPSKSRGPMTVGYREGGALDHFKIFLNTSYPANRRFALMRIVGDNLTASPDDKLLPAPDIKTHRQKFQRAFAQEFLCPYDELKEFIGSTEPEDEKIEDAARHFEVSPLLVTSVLVNKGHIARASLDEYGDRVAA